MKGKETGSCHQTAANVSVFFQPLHLVFAKAPLEPTTSLIRVLSLQHIGPALGGGRCSTRLTQLDRLGFRGDRRRRTVAIRAVGRLHGIPHVLRCRIFLEYGSSPKALESVLFGIRSSHRRRALNGAVVAPRLSVRVAVAAIRPIGIHCVSRLLIAVARVHAISLVVAVPCGVGLHAIVPRSGRTADGTAHTVSGVDITVASALSVTIVATDLRVAILVVA